MRGIEASATVTRMVGARTSVAAAAPTATRPAPAAPAAAVPGSDARELLGGLAGDLGVAREPEPDPPALTVDLDHADMHLVAAVQHVLDRGGALARRDVRDVKQAVGALGEFDAGAEARRLDDLAAVLVADLDLLRHRADALDQRVALLAAGGVHQD